jgi:hypothetical protein
MQQGERGGNGRNTCVGLLVSAPSAGGWLAGKSCGLLICRERRACKDGSHVYDICMSADSSCLTSTFFR